jgi:hypothetical protein
MAIWVLLCCVNLPAENIDPYEDGSHLVGFYYGDSDYPGFLYDGTNWTNIEGPNAYSTLATGINDSNVVGSYSVAGVWHGFLYDDG